MPMYGPESRPLTRDEERIFVLERSLERSQRVVSALQAKVSRIELLVAEAEMVTAETNLDLANQRRVSPYGMPYSTVAHLLTSDIRDALNPPRTGS